MRSAITSLILIPALLCACVAQAQEPTSAAARDLFVTTGKSLVVDSPVNIQRVSVADGALAEAVAVSPREVLVNGRASGETTLIIWQQGGNRLIFDLNVRSNTSAIEAVRAQLAKELPDQDVSIVQQSGNVFLRGTVKDLVAADRAATIAATLGKVVNLLQVEVPPVDAQVLLKVRFANVDRGAARELGANFVSTGAAGTIGSLSTGQFSSPSAEAIGNAQSSFTLTDALNIFLFRPDLNLATTIRALQNKRLLEILAEPNVLAIHGRQASFLAGGEFPFPVVQGGANAGAITIQFREFGVRINFLPRITPRGTIRLQVAPEVSSLDYANGIAFQGVTIPALSTRRVETEIELDSGQSFAIGGLLDNRVIETWSKVPGIGDVPLLGKLFRSYSRSKNNTELLIVVTPELVRPVPADQVPPDVPMPIPMLEWGSTRLPRTPGMNATGPVPVMPAKTVIPVEELRQSLQPTVEAAPAPAAQGQVVEQPAAQPPPAPPAPPAAPVKSSGGAMSGMN